MLTHKIDIFVESRYPADREAIRQAAREVFKESKLKSKAQLSVSIVGDRKMTQLNREYRNYDETTPVLVFSQIESVSSAKTARFLGPPDDILRLGDVVISYPQAREIAKVKNKLIDEVIEELVRHGVSKLLGA